MSKTINSIALFLISLSSLTIGCSASDTVITTEAIGANEPASIVHFDTVDSEKKPLIL